MNPIQELITNFQALVAQVPEIVQPFIVMLAGAIPFIEGEGAAVIGIAGGIPLIIVAIAAAAGNFLSVLLVVIFTSRARSAVVNHTRARREALVGAGGVGVMSDDGRLEGTDLAPVKPESKGRLRFKRWLVRFGVPGASILGPLAIPTQFTSAFLVASGTPRRWVLLWQAVAIALWTTVATVSAWAALTFLVGV